MANKIVLYDVMWSIFDLEGFPPKFAMNAGQILATIEYGICI